MSEIALHDAMTYSVREQDDGQWTLRARLQTWDLDPANWGPEEFTDAIDLVKVDGAWKIGNSNWTVQKSGCTLHPNGPPPDVKN